MNRLSPDNPVRRRLFEALDAEADLDNFSNVIQEEALRVNDEKMRKWNFDFENEKPLEGTYEWTHCDGSFAYTGRIRSEETNETIGNEEDMSVDTDDETCEENVNLLQKKNETTPHKKSTEGKEDAPLLKIDRRRGDPTEHKTGNVFSTDKSVRRNIYFE